MQGLGCSPSTANQTESPPAPFCSVPENWGAKHEIFRHHLALAFFQPLGFMMSHLQQKTSQNWASQVICLFTLSMANRSSNCPCGLCQSQTPWVTPSFLGKRPGSSLVLSEALIQQYWILLHSLVHPVVTLSHPAGSISRMFFRMASQTWLLTPPEEVIAALWPSHVSEGCYGHGYSFENKWNIFLIFFLTIFELVIGLKG